MGPEDSLPCSQEPAAGLYPEPVESIHTLTSCFLKIISVRSFHLRLCLLSDFFPSDFAAKIFDHFCLPIARLISSPRSLNAALTNLIPNCPSPSKRTIFGKALHTLARNRYRSLGLKTWKADNDEEEAYKLRSYSLCNVFILLLHLSFGSYILFSALHLCFSLRMRDPVTITIITILQNLWIGERIFSLAIA
jgi:hypothetical protein